MTTTAAARVFATVILAAAAGCSRGTQDLEPTPAERTDIPKVVRQIPPHEAVAGSNARTALLFTHEIPGMGARVEVREYYVSEGTELAVPTASEAVFEIRSGQFDVQTSGLKGTQARGTTWTAAPNERVVVRTLTQMAVLRAVSIVRQ